MDLIEKLQSEFPQITHWQPPQKKGISYHNYLLWAPHDGVLRTHPIVTSRTGLAGTLLGDNEGWYMSINHDTNGEISSASVQLSFPIGV